MLVMVVKIVFNIVSLLSFVLLPCMFVILRTCHPDGTEGSLPLFLDASLCSSMTSACHCHPACLSSFVLVILTERKDLFPRSFRCFAPLQHDKYLLLSSCLFVILRTCHPDGTEGSLSPFF